MALINKKTFEIVQVTDVWKKKEYFECDDMIAPTISILNKKGYRTLFCCGGHPYDDLSTAVVYSATMDAERIVPPIKGTIKLTKRKDGSAKIIFMSKNSTGVYIVFEDGTMMPEYNPALFKTSGTMITRWVEQKADKTPYDYMSELLEINKKLYEWAKTLPENPRKEED